jgi:hypothetical protein
MGFMLMTDWYGEMPYTEALGSSLSPNTTTEKQFLKVAWPIWTRPLNISK